MRSHELAAIGRRVCETEHDLFVALVKAANLTHPVKNIDPEALKRIGHNVAASIVMTGVAFVAAQHPAGRGPSSVCRWRSICRLLLFPTGLPLSFCRTQTQDARGGGN
ncbi:MAG: hypothetical protein HC784_11515 [Hydrococcus sp. CSU_1_8]|nr:hypothetical protein [Hydrococcus sp. CSU_1_8]